MAERFEPAYAYARVCGSISKAFLGERASNLARYSRISEAWRELFGEEPPVLPEGALLRAAARETRIRALKEIRDLSGGLVETSPFFAALLRKPEFSFVKRIASAVFEKAKVAPENPDPELRPSFDLGSYPSLEGMFSGTRYAWIVGEGAEDLTALKNRVDRQYYQELWLALDALPASSAKPLRELLKLECELENLVWALRLRRYYAMGQMDIEPLLIRLPGCEVKKPALEALGLKPDRRDEWRHWKWERLLTNPRPTATGEWRLDVREFESAARRYVFRKILHSLHFEPFGLVPLYAFFRIKEMEGAAINGVLEGIRLQAPPAEIAAFALDATGAPA